MPHVPAGLLSLARTTTEEDDVSRATKDDLEFVRYLLDGISESIDSDDDAEAIRRVMAWMDTAIARRTT